MQIACGAILCLDSQPISFFSQTVAFHVIQCKWQYLKKKLFTIKCGLTTTFSNKRKIQQDIIGLNAGFRICYFCHIYKKCNLVQDFGKWLDKIFRSKNTSGIQCTLLKCYLTTSSSSPIYAVYLVMLSQIHSMFSKTSLSLSTLLNYPVQPVVVLFHLLFYPILYSPFPVFI